MVRNALIQLISQAIEELVEKQAIDSSIKSIPIEIEPPKQADHGDFATNFCLIASKTAKTNPRALAEILLPAILGAQLSLPKNENGQGGVDQNLLTPIASAEIAGPGFINFHLNPAWAAQFLTQALDNPNDFYKPHNDNPQKINVEFVSVNPNGPITIGSGRGAAFGSALCNVLEAAGNTVHREYYINDGVNSEQMRLFAESVHYYCMLLIGENAEKPSNGYFGDYVEKLSARLITNNDKSNGEVAIRAIESTIENLASWASSLKVRNTQFDVNRVYADIAAIADVAENVKSNNPTYTFSSAISHLRQFVRKNVSRQSTGSLASEEQILKPGSSEAGTVGSINIPEEFKGTNVEIFIFFFIDMMREFDDLKVLSTIDEESRLVVLFAMLTLARSLDAYFSDTSTTEVGFMNIETGFKETETTIFLDMSRKAFSDMYHRELVSKNWQLSSSATPRILGTIQGLTDPSQVVAEYLGDLIGPQTKYKPLSWFQSISQDLMIAAQMRDLNIFRTNFDTWFSEQSLHDSGVVEQELHHLLTNNVADDQPTRTKVVFAKGGQIKEVIQEPQTNSDVNKEATEAENFPPQNWGGQGGVDQETMGATGETNDQPASLPKIGEGQGGVEDKKSTNTIWLRSTKFGDDQDRVLKRADGRLTYIASDVAYHKDKFNRPANGDKLITVLGPDHHGYIARLTAVVAAMFSDQVTPLANPDPLNEHEAVLYTSVEERNQCQAALAWAQDHLEVQIFQLVRFLKDGKPAPMRKRDGNIYALIDLINEIGETLKPDGTTEEKQQAGSDVARFFYLMRHHDTAMDFDLELATKQSDENPVFYVQYAHARICSVIEKASEVLPYLPKTGEGQGGVDSNTLNSPNLTLLQHPKELALILKICDLPNEVARTAADYSVNRLTTYAIELARTYHSFYDSCRVIQPDQPDLSQARLALCHATRIALRAALNLIGVSAPNRMERATQPL